MIITFHKDFTKQFKKLTSDIQEKFYSRLSSFEKDPFNPTLNNHALQGRYAGYRSINVTGDLRALYKKDSEGIHFMEIGFHSNLYG